jgi:hypothetical protein
LVSIRLCRKKQLIVENLPNNILQFKEIFEHLATLEFDEGEEAIF